MAPRPISAIATEAGYENPFYFTQRFKRATGPCPRDSRYGQFCSANAMLRSVAGRLGGVIAGYDPPVPGETREVAPSGEASGVYLLRSPGIHS